MCFVSVMWFVLGFEVVVQCLGFGYVQGVFVDCLVGDGVDDFWGVGVQQFLDVVEIVDVVGGDYWDLCGIGQCGGSFDVVVLYYVVFGNICVDDGGYFVGFEVMSQVDYLDFVDFGLVVGGDEIVFGIQVDDDFVWEGVVGFVDEFRLFDCFGVDDDVVDVGVNVMFDGFQ